MDSEDRFIVELAYRVVDTLARDSCKLPYRRDNEYEVAAELNRRLCDALEAVGLAETWENDRCIGRVGCEIASDGMGLNGSKKMILDAVIWHKYSKMEPHWRALWACELKYKDKSSNQDVKKLQSLLDKHDSKRPELPILQYGCTLNILHAPANAESKVQWRIGGSDGCQAEMDFSKNPLASRLWSCEAQIGYSNRRLG